MDTLIRDLRYALRQLRRSPGFALAAVVTLALGIGANTAVFSVVNGVMLRPLPYEHPERVVQVWNTWEEGRLAVSERELEVYRTLDDVFDGLGAYALGSVNLAGEGDPERVRAGVVSFDLLPLLDARTAAGRVDAPEAGTEGGPDLVVLSHGLWRRRYAADPEIVGRTIRLDGDPYTVIGVVAPDFRLPLDFAGPPAQLYVPTPYAPTPDPRNLHYLNTAGVLRPGVDPETARRRVADAAARLKVELGDRLPDSFSATVVTAREEVAGDVRASLFLLAGAVALVLLIACANVANLLLARGDGRRREMAVRVAMGADGGRLARQLLTESVVLAGIGGAAGVGVAVLGTHMLVAASPPGLPRTGEIGIDPIVLGFAAALTLVVGVLFGLVPALRAARRDPRASLREASRGAAGGHGGARLRRTLVASEIALATALGITAVLVARSFLRLQSVEPGFQAERVLAFEVSPPQARYPDAPAVRSFYERMFEELRNTPGVLAVGGNTNLPLAGTPSDWGVHIQGQGSDEGASDVGPDWHVATEGWFEALGIPVLEGRAFAPEDRADGPQVVVVSRELARRGWPEGGALGARIRMTTDIDTIWRTVIGVVGDVRYRAPGEDPRPAMYLPHAQFPNSSTAGLATLSALDVVVRTTAEPAALASLVRGTVRDLDSVVPVSSLRTMEEVRRASTASERFRGGLLVTFAGLAILLVIVGTYGVIAYLVGRRMREMGVRIALGASPDDLRRAVLGEGLRMAGLGVAAGVAGALALSRALGGFLYGVRATDPPTLLVVPALLLAVAAGAALIPARRAAGVQPAALLREE